MTVLCAAPNCLPRGYDHPARALDGLLLCGHHTARIGHDAHRIAGYHDELAQALALTGGSGVGATHNHPGLSIDRAALETRHQIRELLIGTVRTIANQRGVRLPCHPGGWVLGDELPRGVYGPRAARWRPPTLDDSGPALAAFVDDHRTWLAAHHDAGIISDRYAYLRRRAWGILHADRTVTVLIGSCPMTVTDGVPCRGTVRALIRRSDTLLPLAVSCEDPEHAWPVEELARLGRWIGIKQGRWSSAAELSILYGVPVRRIHQLASIHRWERTTDGLRPTLYSAFDARATPYLLEKLLSATKVLITTADGQRHEIPIGKPLPPGTIEVYQRSGASLSLAIKDGGTFIAPNGIRVTVPRAERTVA